MTFFKCVILFLNQKLNFIKRLQILGYNRPYSFAYAYFKLENPNVKCTLGQVKVLDYF